jgi:hypothetical protein
MRVRHLIVSAALAAILCSVVPAGAGAGGAQDPKVSGSHEHGAVTSGLDDPRFVTTRTGGAPDLNRHDPFDSFRSDAHGSKQHQKTGGWDRETPQIYDLRKFAHVAVQKGRCHPRGHEPDDDHFGSRHSIPVGFFGDDDRHGGHGDHEHPHEPPFCPSPH